MANLLNNELLDLKINSFNTTNIKNPFDLFSKTTTSIWMEIGFGGGEHIALQAENNPTVGFIGCEPFLNGIASLLRDVKNKNLSNIRILADDARPFLARLPDNSIDRLFILFPDPWRKKRHENRRIIQKNILNQFHRLLKIGGEFRLATDDTLYLRWILLHLKDHPGFEWLARRPNDWRLRPSDWPQTRYEKKALMEGRTPIFLRYRKI
tara:strand:+ start:143 stop:769 length:627 start_codon:yes stop_codon:yes gene_type:complete